MQSLLLYFSGLGAVKEGKLHVMGTDGDLVDVEDCFSRALDATSKTKQNSIVTLLDGSYSWDDSQSCASVLYVGSGASESLQPKVHTSSNGNLMLCAMGQPSAPPPAAAAAEEQIKDTSSRNSFRRTVSSSHRRTLSGHNSGSMSARHFNPNLDLFCTLLDKMESTSPEDADVMVYKDADMARAAIASSIRGVVSSHESLSHPSKSLPPGGTFRAQGFEPEICGNVCTCCPCSLHARCIWQVHA